MMQVGLDYIVYVDVLVLLLGANFICDYLLLWATAAVTLAKTTWQRLLIGATLGTLHFLLIYLASLRIIPYYGYLRSIPTIFGITLLMLGIAFYPIMARRMVALLLHFLAIGFGAGGIGLATAYLLGTPTRPNAFLGLLAAMAAILIIAELGWGVIQHRMVRHIYQLPVSIHFDLNQVRVVGLIDTGNHLTDPLTGAPVIIIEQSQVADLLPEELASSISLLVKGDQDALQKLLSSSWSSRFRVIPYSSLGDNNGILIGFRPDMITLEVHGESMPTEDAVVALCNHDLDPAGEYQALIPPIIVQGTLANFTPRSVNLAPLGGERQ
ncbi:MAG: sigma-E processing peptidase SpoIIGA [Firmicutes bacterium]|nr:sigma-E processing peptidase SpoIIGA [Bacillota bacterium]